MNKNSPYFGTFCAPLAFISIGSGLIGFAGFVPPPLPTASAAEIAAHFAANPMITQALNDFAWLFMLSPFSFGVLQNCAIGIAILGDRSPQPLFPRWVAYFNFWATFLYLPAG